MRVLHITPTYEPAWDQGGVVRSVSQLCRGLAALGVDVTVYTTDSNGRHRLQVPVNQIVELGGVKVIYFATKWSNRFRYSGDLARACWSTISGFDLAHLTTFWCYPGIPAGQAARKFKVPYVVSPRGTFIRYPLRQKWLKKWFYMKLVEWKNLRGAAAIHYTTEMERELTAHLGLKVPSFIVPNGVDPAEFDNLPSRAESRVYFGLSPSARVVAFCGRLHPRKALDILVSAFADVRGEIPDAHLLLAGPDDGHEQTLRNLVGALRLQNNVHFLGYVNPEKRKRVLAATDLFALVSYPGENFGNAAAEAMMAGVPVLLSNNVGICREVEADGAGRVVPVDKGAISQALIELLSNPARLEAMGQRARQSARRRYGIEAVAMKMLTAYEDILMKRNSPECLWSLP